jgi:FAD/FMN-containing dehydrogenase
MLIKNIPNFEIVTLQSHFAPKPLGIVTGLTVAIFTFAPAIAESCTSYASPTAVANPSPSLYINTYPISTISTVDNSNITPDGS